MATYSSILAWRIPWTEEPDRLQSMGSQSWTQLSDYTTTTIPLPINVYVQMVLVNDDPANQPHSFSTKFTLCQVSPEYTRYQCTQKKYSEM